MRNSFIVAVNQIQEVPLVKNGQIVACPVLNLNFTTDHRFMDGGAVLKSNQAVFIIILLYRCTTCLRILRSMVKNEYYYKRMNNFISKYAISLSSIVKKCNNSQLNLVVMHGLLGSKKNFRSFSNSDKICGNVRETHLLDLRNHGESPHCDNMSLSDMALDLREYIQNLDNVILLGHSLGGRVIFQYLHDQMQDEKIKGTCN